jgi:hypothetical protein
MRQNIACPPNPLARWRDIDHPALASQSQSREK